MTDTELLLEQSQATNKALIEIVHKLNKDKKDLRVSYIATVSVFSVIVCLLLVGLLIQDNSPTSILSTIITTV